jgi:hypothetical protein
MSALAYRSEPADGDLSPEAGAPEIEVTPAMIEAGLVELAWHEDISRSNEQILREIFRDGGGVSSPLKGGVRQLT